MHPCDLYLKKRSLYVAFDKILAFLDNAFWRACGVCVCVTIRAFVCSHHQQPAASTKESAPDCENEPVSGSVTMAAAPPQLVLIRRRSQSLTDGLSEAAKKMAVTNGSPGNHKSKSADLHLRNVPSTDQVLNVPRIIVISPTSEDCLVKHESSFTEDGSVATVVDEDSLEDNDVV